MAEEILLEQNNLLGLTEVRYPPQVIHTLGAEDLATSVVLTSADQGVLEVLIICLDVEGLDESLCGVEIEIVGKCT